MKLAEALLIRSDQQKKIASLKQRINNNVLVQEGDIPSEDPNQLLQEVFLLAAEYQKMIYRIHLTNARTVLKNGKTLLAQLTQRDALVERHKILIAAIEQTHREPDRYSSREIKWNKVIQVSSFQKQADDTAAKIRDLNIQIQAQNWQVDLMDDISEE
ncbi:DIP1984 family protein [Acinetobacter nectaris]|uniref:DIP1984 family protein n=1 Tax=Acinetobacter nectaris TaxID=1219382 RepID=UPI001F2A17F7|nr:DIP1984 family protein [Acinetobacter nectaris]MCF9045637.1 DIP1984 family protein [Acinetobacter nectaris]